MTTIYVAAPIARRDDGAITTADAERCETAEAAIKRAESLSRSQGYIGGWAFTPSAIRRMDTRPTRC